MAVQVHGDAHVNGIVIHHDLMITGFYQATRKVFKLLAGLDEKVVSWWNTHWDTLSSVSCPDVEARITRASMYGKEVEICVKAGKSSVLFAVLYKIRSCRRKQMGTVMC